MEYVRVVTPDEPRPQPPADPALVTGYSPDRFQAFAIEAIEAGDNVLVTAKTGSGKTFVGEYQIAASLRRGGRVFYTTPIKSLSNQKFHDLKTLFPQASVGIMTGDIKFRPDAQIIIMTTEILRNLLFKRGTLTEHVGLTATLSLDGLDAVVFDEVHYINDKDRGHVWEETLMLLPPSIKLILLSATLSSPQIFAEWLGRSKQRKVWLISTLWRAVPLEHCVIGSIPHGGHVSGALKPLVIMDAKESFNADTYRAWLATRRGDVLAHDKFKQTVRDARRGGVEGPISGKTRPKAFEHELNECVNWLRDSHQLPAIAFVFSRAGCETLASKVTSTFLDTSDTAAVAHIWDFHLNRYKSMLEKSPQAHRLRELALRGIAFHHSGLLPFLKEILEILFSKGYIKLLFATETFAVGINMPTKTVIFTALEKYTDGTMRPLNSAEYIQMAGRAGRRGKDDRGLVLYVPQREPLDLLDMRSMLTGKSASFGSRMNFGYDFIMKILNGGQKGLVQGSYWWALEEQEARRAGDEVARLTADADTLVLTEAERETCQEKADIEHKIASSQNAKKKQALREFETWKAEHKDSVWNPIYERFLKKRHAEDQVSQASRYHTECLSHRSHTTLPEVSLRLNVLSEFGYVVVDEGSENLTDSGLLASEINEGHPFLMTEMFLRISRNKSIGLKEIISTLAVFLGECKNDVVRLHGYPLIDDIYTDAVRGMAIEKRHGLSNADYWMLNDEWVQPITSWLEGEHSLASLAAEFGVFEGNIQKALMKLAGLLEEFQALATLAKDVEMLKVLENGRGLILRDLILAESLYLRL